VNQISVTKFKFLAFIFSKIDLKSKIVFKLSICSDFSKASNIVLASALLHGHITKVQTRVTDYEIGVSVSGSETEVDTSLVSHHKFGVRHVQFDVHSKR